VLIELDDWAGQALRIEARSRQTPHVVEKPTALDQLTADPSRLAGQPLIGDPPGVASRSPQPRVFVERDAPAGGPDPGLGGSVDEVAAVVDGTASRMEGCYDRGRVLCYPAE
jgi:hypothetical protein